MSKLLEDKFWAEWEREGIRNGNIVNDPEWTATASKSQLDEAFENRRKAQFKVDKLEWENRKEDHYVPVSIHRLSRNAAFLMSLRDSGIDITCCDFPTMDRLTCGILALVAERERELISSRVVAGLAQAKKSGKVLGCPVAASAWSKAMVSIRANKQAFADKSMRSINEIRSTGITSLSRIAQYMNLRGERTRLGGKWTTTAVKRCIATATA